MFKFGLENISYQGGDKFFDDLTSLCQEIHDGVKNGAIRKCTDKANIACFERLSKLVKNRMGLNVIYDADLSPMLVAAIVAFAADSIGRGDSMGRGNVSGFGVDMAGAGMSFQQLQKRIFKIQDNAKIAGDKVTNTTGTINIHRAVVTGYFTKVPHVLAFDSVALVNDYGMGAGELAAVITHEIGHAFTGLENHHRLVQTNTEIQNALNDVNNNKTREAVYRFKNIFTKEEFEKAQLSDDSEIADFYAASSQFYVDQMVRSQYQEGSYDETSWEHSADSFAVRFGFGSQLATGLRKLETHPNSGIAKRAIWNMHNFWVILIIMSMNPLAWAIISFIAYLRATMVSTYDDTKERYGRMMRDINAILKDPKLPTTYKRTLTDQWEVIRDIFDTTNNQIYIDASVWKFLLPSLRKRKYYTMKQTEISQLLNNELFTQTARIELLGENQ